MQLKANAVPIGMKSEMPAAFNMLKQVIDSMRDMAAAAKINAETARMTEERYAYELRNVIFSRIIHWNHQNQ